jgi:predicted nucleic acid-binding protein
LAKLYLVEPDSAVFEALALAAPVVIGMITRHELRTVFRRREAEAAIPAGEATALYQHMASDAASGVLRLQPDSDDVEREFGMVLETCFSQTPPVFIRTNDALHLASARVAGETEFVTADLRQREAAQLLGFKLLP